MISIDKAFLSLVQTLCVGGLCIGLVVSNSDKLNKADGDMPMAIIGSVLVTMASAATSLGLAYENNR